ncbi:MAG: hypothetical protein EBS58_06510, partial [Micrococcales bacterium]|nr:hypothetical protein [Micrococcales bacterium]
IDTDTKPTAPVPAVWPWIALVVILLSTIAVITWAGIVAPKPTITPSPSPSQTKTETPTPTPEPTETVENVVILLSNYQGLDVSLVVPQLAELGVIVDPIAGTTVPADDPRISQVYDISPLGSIAKDSTVQVYYYQQEPEPIPEVIN